MKKILALILAITFVMASTSMVFANENVVQVSTIDELIAAIASDTKIVMSAGEYVVPSEWVTSEWGDYEIGKSIVIDGINNLEIVGTGVTKVALDVGYLPVFEVLNSSNITFTGLTIGHNVPEYGCEGEGDCISLFNSSNITINNCDLYGCGVMAIYGAEVSDIYVNDSILRDCMINAISIYGLAGEVEVNNCKLYGNAYDSFSAQTSPFLIFYAKDGETPVVNFNNCEIYDNKNTEFKLESGEITANVTVNLNECNVYDNAWETAINVKVSSPWSPGQYEKIIFYDQLPILVNDRTMVPVRAIFEYMNYTVEWIDETQTVVIINSDSTKTVKIPIGSSNIYANGTEVYTDVPAQVINDRTYLPLRAISEAFELNVEWEDETNTVYID